MFVFYRFDPSVLDTSFSPFNCTLTLALPSDDNFLTYQVGPTEIGTKQISNPSPIFQKPSKNNVVYYYLKWYAET